MALTRWTNDHSGKRLDAAELAVFRVRAHRLYEANTLLFEDERDALSALGVMAPADIARCSSHRLAS